MSYKGVLLSLIQPLAVIQKPKRISFTVTSTNIRNVIKYIFILQLFRFSETYLKLVRNIHISLILLQYLHNLHNHRHVFKYILKLQILNNLVTKPK